MPRATLDTTFTERHDLKTCPGGYVVLRKLSYGQILERRALMKLSVTTRKGQKNLEGELAMANRRIQEFEFQKCVVDHNLEDDMERKLNLSDPVVLQTLDPRIGAEIEALISDLNNFEDDDEAEQGN